jgi:crossover junction endodeoxyribonuclease RusA
MILLELPFPPSVNHYYRRWRGRTLISREGRKFRARVVSILAARGMRRLDGPLMVEVDVYPPDHRRRDIDNVQKSLFDAIQHGGVYRDDSQIDDIHIRRRTTFPGGKVIVRINTIANH